MTKQEFDELQPTLACRHCGESGRLSTGINRNNNGMFVKCLCGWPNPLEGVFFLGQKPRAKTAKRAAQDETMDEVWERFGNRCSCCGTHIADLDRLLIGRHKDHEPPLASVDDESQCFLVPMCSWCHELHTGSQRAVRRVIDEMIKRAKRGE